MQRFANWRRRLPFQARGRQGRPALEPEPAIPPVTSQYGALIETLGRLGYRPKGIIHAGAHHGEQMEQYLALNPARIAWIEADPDSVAVLRQKVAAFGDAPAEQTVIHALISDRDGETRPFYRFSNRGESSSLFHGTDLLRQTWPGLHETGEVLQLPTSTFNSALLAHGAVPHEFDVMVVDLQGGELLALRGAGAFLDAAEFLEVEVSTKAYYDGGALAGEITSLLGEHGFTAVTPIHDHGDTVFRRRRR